MENIKHSIINIVAVFKEDKISNIISSIVAVLGTIGGYAFGGFDTAMRILLYAMGLDFILGVLCGVLKGNLGSRFAFLGIAKKFTILVLVSLGTKLDIMTNADGVLRGLMIFFYMGQEGISIVENATVLGVPVPEKLKDSLIQLRDGNKKDFSNKKE